MEAYFAQFSGNLLLAFERAAVGAEALVSPQFHVENSLPDHANMRVVELGYPAPQASV